MVAVLFSRMRRFFLAALAAVSALVITGTPAVAADPYYVASIPEYLFKYSPGSGALVDNRVNLWSTGAATTFINLVQPTIRFQFDVQADQCTGLPRLEVAIDDQTLLSRDIAGFGTYGVTGNWAAGRHKVTLRFKNDFRSSTCDRNLTLTRFFFTGRLADGSVVPVATEQRLLPKYSSIDPSTAGSVGVQPGFESLGPVPLLRNNGSVKFQLDSQGAYEVWAYLRARGCEGNPSYRLIIDGAVRAEGVVPTPSESANDPTVLVFDGRWPNGLHNVEVVMFNDHTTSTCDRSLLLQSFFFRGRV